MWIGDGAVTPDRGVNVVEPVRPYIQGAAPLRTAHPFLPRARVEVDPEVMHVNWNRSKRLRRVQQNRDPGGTKCVNVDHFAADPRDVRAGDQLRLRTDLAR